VDLLSADRERCEALLEASCAFAASYVPVLGYDQVAAVITRNQGEPEKVRRELESLTGEKGQ
jgi:aspartate ammonia-lyase